MLVLTIPDKLFTGKKPPDEINVIDRLNESKILKSRIFKMTKIANVNKVYKINIFEDCFKVSDTLNDKKLVKAAINNLNNPSSSSSGSTDDKIAQAKQICKDLGFKTKTEKFADCSLKMLSMQFEVQNRETSSDGGTQQKIVVNQGYSVGDAMIALSGIISDANNVRSSYGGGNCRIFQHAYHASLKCN